MTWKIYRLIFQEYNKRVGATYLALPIKLKFEKTKTLLLKIRFYHLADNLRQGRPGVGRCSR